MRALTIEPGTKDSVAVTEVPVPEPADDELLVTGLAIGVCGTDRELNGGLYGWAPPGEDLLVIGHESLGRVEAAPEGSGFAVGDLIAGVVRRPDPVPCPACAHGEFDMCRNGEYTERGIKELNGFGSEQWVVKQDFAIKLDPALGQTGVLMEPTSVVAKAWDEVFKVGGRAFFDPQSVVIVGGGTIGLLAALLGGQRGLEVHVVNSSQKANKEKLVTDLGGHFHVGDLPQVLAEVRPDIVLDTTGDSGTLADILESVIPYQVVCLLGMHDPQDPTGLDLATIGKQIVLDNVAIVGSVNANVRHWQQAAEALAAADGQWLSSLITRTVPLTRALEAFDHERGDIKVVIDLQA